ncbi:hypothetical protein D9M70_488810 [compost metagenome]
MVGRFLLLGADGDDLGPVDAGGAQHVETIAVAEIDAETEGRGLAHARCRMVDDRHVAAAGEQDLRGDLAEAGKADHQHVGIGAVEIFLDLLVHLILFAHQLCGQHGGKRRQRHRQCHDRNQ